MCIPCTASQPPNISMHESFGRHTLTQPYHEDPMRHTLTQLPPEAHTEHTLTQPLHKTPAIHANDLVRTVSPRSKQVGMASSNDHTSVQDSPQADAIQPVDWEVIKICPSSYYTNYPLLCCSPRGQWLNRDSAWSSPSSSLSTDCATCSPWDWRPTWTLFALSSHQSPIRRCS